MRSPSSSVGNRTLQKYPVKAQNRRSWTRVPSAVATAMGDRGSNQPKPDGLGYVRRLSADRVMPPRRHIQPNRPTPIRHRVSASGSGITTSAIWLPAYA